MMKHESNESQEKYVNEKINLHVAEYNALTTRCTYFMSFQFILLGALIAWFTFGLYIWNSERPCLLAWLMILGAQIFELVSAWNLHEQYIAVHYLEKVLKPKIHRLIHNEDFWEYETTLALARDHRLFKQRELFGLIFFLILVISTFVSYCFTLSSGWINIIGFLLNLILWVFVAMKTFESLKIKRNLMPDKKKKQH